MPLNEKYIQAAQKSEYLSSVNLNPLTPVMKSALRTTYGIPDSLPVDALLFDKSTAVSTLTYDLNISVRSTEKFAEFMSAPEGMIYIPLPEVFKPGYVAIGKSKDRYYSVTTVNDENIMFRYSFPNLGEKSLDAIIQYSALFSTIPLGVLKKARGNKKPITIIKNVVVNDEDLGFKKETKAWTMTWNGMEGCIEITDINLGFNDPQKELAQVVEKSSQVFFILEKLG